MGVARTIKRKRKVTKNWNYGKSKINLVLSKNNQINCLDIPIKGYTEVSTTKIYNHPMLTDYRNCR